MQILNDCLTDMKVRMTDDQERLILRPVKINFLHEYVDPASVQLLLALSAFIIIIIVICHFICAIYAFYTSDTV